MLSVWEIAQEVFGAEDAPSESEKKSVYGCLKRLEKRGLVRGRQSWLREIGAATVWRSLTDPGRKVLDPGG
ncbi:PadR family transcriptional regulator [Nocardia sp. NEAU-G5]|uniref:PadR family transcriptional regulator n=1 Tax=Nocardia albiluteola TaxID=2842303 RepID=A0ABS6B7Y8_9NOCA|nr:PadR family transcriptional regulator [Nocardia albiluteola]MBU3066417.1 PadR family transcriptional regulator [Nocardia albiluteola]